MEYEPDADMIFNYLMVSALAAATDFVEKEGLKPSGGKIGVAVVSLGDRRVPVVRRADGRVSREPRVGSE